MFGGCFLRILCEGVGVAKILWFVGFLWGVWSGFWSGFLVMFDWGWGCLWVLV